MLWSFTELMVTYLPFWPVVWIGIGHVRQGIKFNCSMATYKIVAIFGRQVIRSIMLDILVLFEETFVGRHLAHDSL